MAEVSDCTRCGQPSVEAIAVLDADGSHRVCGLCAVQLIASFERQGGVTVIPSPITAAA